MINNIKKNKNKSIVILSFVMLYIAGVFCSFNYGVPYDVRSEEYILMTNLKSYAELLSPDLSKKIHTFSNLPDIAEYKEKDHGKAMYYPLGAVKLMFYPKESTYQHLSHIYTFSLNFAGIIFLYLTAKMLFKRRLYALTASLLYAFSPRISAELFYNDKDMIFATLFIASFYFSIRFLEKRKLSSAVLLAITSAFACNTRVLGLLVPAWTLCSYLFLIIKNKKFTLKSITPVILAVITFIITFVIITPATWPSLIDYFTYTVSNSANFMRWKGTVFYNGNYYNALDGTLPRSYIPVIIIATTPVIISALILAGFITFIVSFIKSKQKDSGMVYLLSFLVISLLPMVYAVISHSNVYNGWRHFYFVYPSLILIAVYTFKRIKNKKITAVTAALCCLFCFAKSAAFFPHGYVYYNQFIDKNKYEQDYWNVSTAECLENLLSQTDETIKIIGSDPYSNEGLINARLIISSPERVALTDKTDDADYVYVNPMYYNISKHADKLTADIAGSEKVSEVKVDGLNISEIYKMR